MDPFDGVVDVQRELLVDYNEVIRFFPNSTGTGTAPFNISAGAVRNEGYEMLRCDRSNLSGRAPLQIEDHSADVRALYDYLTGSKKCRWTLQPLGGGRIPYGQQHSTLVSIAGTLRARRVCDEAIEACLQIINTRQCERPGPPENIARIVRSSRRWGAMA